MSTLSHPAAPAAQVVEQAQRFAYAAPTPAPSGVTARSYLEVLAGTVLHFRQFQNKNASDVNYGRIIDPYAGYEVQYSTPCFAFAGSTLLAHDFFAGNATLAAQLAADVSLAMTAALSELAYGQPVAPTPEKGCAQGHCNFFMMPLMLAMRTFGALPAAQRPEAYPQWQQLVRSIDVTKAFRGPDGVTGGNWGIVAITGEYLRWKLGLNGNLSWVTMALAEQAADARWTDNGQYMDRSGCNGKCNPMPYDHFPRKCECTRCCQKLRRRVRNSCVWRAADMAVMLQEGYTDGNASHYFDMMTSAAWVSLLMQSPWGELPTGARSSQHQWNEAVSCVTFELFASRYAAAGDAQAAGVFKRAAALSLKSLMRWKRPTGDWWILKNRFDPALRHGYEGYSFDAQYNLLPASMLATAFLYANDSIAEGASFAEVGGFAFQPDGFHKVFANAGGMYAEVELFADQPTHDSTGLTRVHHLSADPLVTTTAGAPLQPEGAPAPNPGGGLGIGAAWTVQGNSTVHNLASATYDTTFATNVSIDLAGASPAGVNFTVVYELSDSTIARVIETYSVLPSSVTATSQLSAVVGSPVTSMSATFPGFLYDGERHTTVTTDGAMQRATVELPGDATSQLGTTCGVYEFLHPLDGRAVTWTRADNVTSRNGYMTRISATVEVGTTSPSVSYRVTPVGGPCPHK